MGAGDAVGVKVQLGFEVADGALVGSTLNVGAMLTVGLDVHIPGSRDP